MPQVQLFKGTKQKLSNTPLTNGGIYFIPEERRLYIDTATERVPILGNGLECYLHFTNWQEDVNEEAYSSTTVCYLTKGGNLATSLNLSEVLGEESIVFIGKIYNNENFTISTIDDIELTEIDNQFVAKPFEIEENGKVYYHAKNNTLIDSNGQSILSDIWVYLYCPNPKVSGIFEPVISTVVTTTATIYGLDLDNTNDTWYRDATIGEYRYDLLIEGVDLTTHPFMIALSDDALENYKEFFDKHITLEDIEATADGSIIHLVTNKIDLISYEPRGNITIDIVAFIYDKFLSADGTTMNYNLYEFIIQQEGLLTVTDFNSNQAYDSTNQILTIPNMIINENTTVSRIDNLSYQEAFKIDEKGNLIMIIDLKDHELFTPLARNTQQIKTNINTWVANNEYYYKKIERTNKTAAVVLEGADDFVELAVDPDTSNSLPELVLGKINYYITNNSIKLYYKENNHDPDVKIYKIINFNVIYKDTIEQDPIFIYYQSEDPIKRQVYYTLYSFIENIETSGITDEEGQYHVTQFKLTFSKDLKYLLGKENPPSEIYQEYLNNKYINDLTSLESCKVMALQTNNLANIYKTILYSDSGWVKIDDIEAFEQQYFDNYQRDSLRHSNTYYVCAKPQYGINETQFKLSRKHMPLIFPATNKELFNSIVETKIASNGKIYFYANRIPKEDIEIYIIDFK